MFCDRVVRDTGKRPEAVATGSQDALMRHTFDRKALQETLRGRGVRMTAQRRILIGIIQSAEQHLDAARLLELARQKDASMDRATVYRTLELLKKHGLVDELDLMHLQGEKHFYEVRTRREHMHLACFRCQDIVEFASPLYEKLKQEMAKQTGFELQVMRLEAGGLCAQCRGAAPEAANQGK